jgi:hypothetical protein
MSRRLPSTPTAAAEADEPTGDAVPVTVGARVTSGPTLWVGGVE